MTIVNAQGTSLKLKIVGNCFSICYRFANCTRM